MQRKYYKDYEYLVLQMKAGHLCGYVKLPEKHPYYGKSYWDMEIDCHGDLSFGEFIIEADRDDEWKGHDKEFWIGWDYNHSYDYDFGHTNPYRTFIEGEQTGIILTQPFAVEEECFKVIDQLINKEVL